MIPGLDFIQFIIGMRRHFLALLDSDVNFWRHKNMTDLVFASVDCASTWHDVIFEYDIAIDWEYFCVTFSAAVLQYKATRNWKFFNKKTKTQKWKCF